MWRTRFTWTGWVGSPGYSDFYASDTTGTAQGFANDAWGLLNDIFGGGTNGTNLPSIVRISQDPIITQITDDNGQQAAQIAITPGAQIAGISTGNFAAAVGACITWNTNHFINGRRLRGRTFLVPLSGVCFAADGTLSTAFIATVQGAVQQYLGKPSEAVVWHRPTSVVANDGDSHPIVTGVMTDKAAVLTTRRD